MITATKSDTISLFEGHSISTRYDKQHDAIIWQPKGRVWEEEWEESFRAGLSYLFKCDTGRTAWVNDTLEVHCVGDNAIYWLDENVNKPLRALGRVMKVAFIHPKHNLANASVLLYKALTQTNNEPIAIAMFDRLEDVWAWLNRD